MTSPSDPFVAELWTRIQALYAPIIAGAQTATTAAETATTKAGEAAGSAVAANVARADAQTARDEAIMLVPAGTVDWNGTYTFAPDQVAKPAWHRRRLTGNSTITFPPGVSGKVYTVGLEAIQDTVGNRALNITNIQWSDSDIAPALSTAPSVADYILALWTGSKWLGSIAARGIPV
ncbi:hypothetical protein SEA_REYNAULD_41 [Rhodococcus phage Reynauld]|uniref:Uncharacterized protein n=1 Tax=Rhodococcus phage Reynauld TaxID=3062845 RepID=A0ACD4UHI2_9CAUD|nr:hypothetical protein SEA_REYNAULD_41 [Rhodococcus phage Reynauld]